MFTLEGNLKFLNVNQDYLLALYNCCSEVFYKPTAYEDKPYVGILLSCNSRKYIVPLTSAKPKHKTLKNIDGDRFLLYELEEPTNLSSTDIWVKIDEDSKVKHILSLMDVKKMIPVRDDVISIVNLNPDPHDSIEETKYKDLLSKEYKFCLGILDKIIDRASKLYDDQKRTGKVTKFSCDFSALEQVCDTYVARK